MITEKVTKLAKKTTICIYSPRLIHLNKYRKQQQYDHYTMLYSVSILKLTAKKKKINLIVLTSTNCIGVPVQRDFNFMINFCTARDENGKLLLEILRGISHSQFSFNSTRECTLHL